MQWGWWWCGGAPCPGRTGGVQDEKQAVGNEVGAAGQGQMRRGEFGSVNWRSVFFPVLRDYGRSTEVKESNFVAGSWHGLHGGMVSSIKQWGMQGGREMEQPTHCATLALCPTLLQSFRHQTQHPFTQNRLQGPFLLAAAVTVSRRHAQPCMWHARACTSVAKPGSSSAALLPRPGVPPDIQTQDQRSAGSSSACDTIKRFSC